MKRRNLLIVFCFLLTGNLYSQFVIDKIEKGEKLNLKKDITVVAPAVLNDNTLESSTTITINSKELSAANFTIKAKKVIVEGIVEKVEIEGQVKIIADEIEIKSASKDLEFFTNTKGAIIFCYRKKFNSTRKVSQQPLSGQLLTVSYEKVSN